MKQSTLDYFLEFLLVIGFANQAVLFSIVSEDGKHRIMEVQVLEKEDT